MNTLLNQSFILKNSIDVYITNIENNQIIITFHRITTRDRIEIKSNQIIAKLIALFDKKRTIFEILKVLNLENQEDEVINLIKFLLSNDLIIDSSIKCLTNHRYDRQIIYFDDMIVKYRGEYSQEILTSKTVLFLGCGAYSSSLSEILVRSGVSNIILVDYKTIEKNNIDKHLFARQSDIGLFKTDVLSKYLKRINSKVSIVTYNEKILPNTDLSNLITKSIDLVINGLDEPYIGYTSLKIGRFCHNIQLPLYIMGGFDAHLMSSGELIYPPETPCIDCIQKTFQHSLKNWKPRYLNNNKESNNALDYQSNHLGGAAGTAIMSGFSSYLSAFNIINFLISSEIHNKTIRYEYLLNKGRITRFETQKQTGCKICHE